MSRLIAIAAAALLASAWLPAGAQTSIGKDATTKAESSAKKADRKADREARKAKRKAKRDARKADREAKKATQQ
jgi:hypothetical protein